MSTPEATVLVVEDEQGLAELFEIWLADAFDVETVTTGRDALETLGEHIDVVVLDWRMPEVSGEEILEQIRERNLTCRVAVVTGLEPEVANIGDAADAVLRKPVDAEELIGVVERLSEEIAAHSE